MKLAVEGPSISGKYWLRVVANNSLILTSSQQYAEKRSAIHAAQLIKAHAGAAEIVDETTN